MNQWLVIKKGLWKKAESKVNEVKCLNIIYLFAIKCTIDFRVEEEIHLLRYCIDFFLT